MSDLEQPELDEPLESDWGGDGADRTRTVRAHVLAALSPTSAPYPPPVNALLSLGDAREISVEVRRSILGIGQEHVPDLVRMARDRALNRFEDDNLAGWAPVHAIKILEGLDATEVVADLVPLLDVDSDWFRSALSEIFARVGQPALGLLRSYLADPSRWVWGHVSVTKALEAIAKRHPNLRDEAVASLSTVLHDPESYSDYACTFAMSALVELDAVEALPLIRQAFELDKIDEMVRGPWDRVLDDLGIEPDPDDPLVTISRQRDEEQRERFFPRALRERFQSALAALSQKQPLDQLAGARPIPPPEVGSPARQHKAEERARKEKNKRKASSASRKANRKKRK